MEISPLATELIFRHALVDRLLAFRLKIDAPICLKCLARDSEDTHVFFMTFSTSSFNA